MYRIKIIEHNSGQRRYICQVRRKFLWMIPVWASIDRDHDTTGPARICYSITEAQSCIENFDYYRREKYGKRIKRVTYVPVTPNLIKKS